MIDIKTCEGVGIEVYRRKPDLSIARALKLVMREIIRIIREQIWILGHNGTKGNEKADNYQLCSSTVISEFRQDNEFLPRYSKKTTSQIPNLDRTNINLITGLPVHITDEKHICPNWDCTR